jgi:LysR family cys regulon transcriptional activator
MQVQIVHKHDEELWQLVQNGEVDLAITTDTKDLPRSLLAVPCYPMNRIVLAPSEHPLLRVRRLTLEAIADYPLITYDERSSGRRRLMKAFAALGYTPKIAVTAADEDVIKACVEKGLGIAIVASIVFDRKRDTKLGAADITPLLESSTTSVVLRRNAIGDSHVRDFITAFARDWSAEKIERHAVGTAPKS